MNESTATLEQPLPKRSLLAAVGPGILFAATCIGTSHLVQSTRAGANYGLAMGALILLACAIKYPAFRFGADYAAATGNTLLNSYSHQGRWAVAVCVLEILATMFIATAAIVLVTAGLMKNVLSLNINIVFTSTLLLGLTAAILIGGKFHLFEKVTKAFVLLFLVLILTAVALALPELDISAAFTTQPFTPDRNTLLFMIAVAGWMPAAMGASIFQSIWVCAKSKDLGRPMEIRETQFDFNLGYGMTVLLALAFLVLGTVLMFQPGIATATSANGFAEQLISLFTQSIGDWAYPVIAAAAVAVMFSTLLTLVDACPRALERLIAEGEKRYYPPLVILQCVGAMIILLFFLNSFKAFIDFATSVAFLLAPLIAWMNHMAMRSKEVPQKLRPSKGLVIWSWMGIGITSAFALAYLYLTFE
ncbi:divalent metal cation transporter [Pseudomaricurvus alkylphenolicus]|uniref:NRAMP family divalent metal transporter n=1 Tax=Pseudomaricurvus alkylphenolicus TaxID=1306991 RepID=UPI001423D403|nr:divalent metal cation transporter [Pseudomaricurvus alkylphenolicus]NIB38645.1 divalent metal cation transporter [Pseudomaricurvus alkylphenolicus]